MRLKPRPGFQYRDTATHQLVDPKGFDADPCDLDIVRALECGDLVRVNPKPPGRPTADTGSKE